MRKAFLGCVGSGTREKGEQWWKGLSEIMKGRRKRNPVMGVARPGRRESEKLPIRVEDNNQLNKQNPICRAFCLVLSSFKL